MEKKKKTPKGGVGLGRVRKQLINKGIAFPLDSEGRHMMYITSTTSLQMCASSCEASKDQ